MLKLRMQFEKSFELYNNITDIIRTTINYLGANIVFPNSDRKSFR